MKDSCYLIINPSGIVGMRKNKPDLTSGQVTVEVSVKVPDRFFDMTVPKAVIEIPEDAIMTPEVDVKISDLPAEVLEESGEKIRVELERRENRPPDQKLVALPRGKKKKKRKAAE